jgi:hypothetical protein
MSLATAPTAAAEAVAAGAFTIFEAWPALSQDGATEVSAFWRRENAIPSPADVATRLKQVVLYARAANGEVAGVATAIATVPARFGQPMYYLRAFVGREWRATPLVREIVLRSCAALEVHARESGFPCIGVMLELENARFYKSLRKPVWWNPRFYYVGISERGLEERALYFEGARLKTRAEIQGMRLAAR